MPITDISCELDDDLHALHLPLYRLIEVFGIDFRKKQEMNGTRVYVRILRNELP